jgi:hypothetical protein
MLMRVFDWNGTYTSSERQRNAAAFFDNGRHEGVALSSDVEAATLSARSAVQALRPLLGYFGLDATPAANTSVAIDLGCVKLFTRFRQPPRTAAPIEP